MKPVPKTAQNVPRAERLSGKDLTLLIRQKMRGVAVKYIFDEGWYACKGEATITRIGGNWVEARDYIHQMPTNQGIIPKILIKLRKSITNAAE